MPEWTTLIHLSAAAAATTYFSKQSTPSKKSLREENVSLLSNFFRVICFVGWNGRSRLHCAPLDPPDRRQRHGQRKVPIYASPGSHQEAVLELYEGVGGSASPQLERLWRSIDAIAGTIPGVGSCGCLTSQGEN